MEKHFNKNLNMNEEEEEFQSSNTCWICEKLIEDEKARDQLPHNWKMSCNEVVT